MLSHAITDARAWRSTTIDGREGWYYPLSPRCLAALDETIRRFPTGLVDHPASRPEEFTLRATHYLGGRDCKNREQLLIFLP
jgi:hypothetical protein